MTRSHQDYAALARDVAAEAAATVREAFRRGGTLAEQKPDGSFVTATDFASQRMIEDALRSATPDFGMYAEEDTQGARTRAEFNWIVDPLDGTANFAFGVPCFAVQIALEHRGRVVAAALALPNEDLVLHAWRGGGAYANGERIRVSSRSMDRGLMLLETRWSEVDFDIARLFGRKVHSMRVLSASCVSLAYVALGRADMLIDYDDKPWDMAAGTLLVEEAGGRVTDLRGRPFRVYEPDCIASNGVDHDRLVAMLAELRAVDPLSPAIVD